MTRSIAAVLAAWIAAATPASAQDNKAPVFSGPQVGEKLPDFKVKGVFGDAAGKELNFVKAAAGKPIVLVFIHDVNRMSIGMTRTLTAYTASRAKDGLHTGVVWLADDVTEAENTLKRVGHALAQEAPLGISTDGKEGPGSYGLNRSVMLTILVGKGDKVTANFPLVQPSLQADLPKILDEVVKVAGGTAPKLADLVPGMAGRDAKGRPKADPAQRTEPDPKVRELLSPVIRLNATPEQVDTAAKAVEEHAAAKGNEAFRKEIGRIANTIIDGGKLESYGTARARDYLKKWAKEYGEKKDPR